MNKFKLLKALVLSSIILGGFSSCKGTNVTDIDIKAGYATDVQIGKFNVADYKIVETYSNGQTKEIQVTEDMIPDTSRIALNTVGQQKIEVVYLKTSIYINLNITRATFDVTMPKRTYSYDGKPHTLELVGYYPKNTVITYPSGSSFTSVGTYPVQAILTCDNYETKTIDSEITITSADYNLDISFEDKTFTYDETEHRIEVSGTLPKEVTVSYTINGEIGNSAIDAGTYVVTAIFTSSNKNYNPIPNMTATMTVNKAVYSTSLLSIGKQDVAYTGEEIEWTIVNKLPSWISVTYVNTYIDEYGNVAPNTSYVQKEIGQYECVVQFHIFNSNYEEIPNMTFEVWIY